MRVVGVTEPYRGGLLCLSVQEYWIKGLIEGRMKIPLATELGMFVCIAFMEGIQ